jgi:hypothetical protein
MPWAGLMQSSQIGNSQHPEGDHEVELIHLQVAAARGDFQIGVHATLRARWTVPGPKRGPRKTPMLIAVWLDSLHVAEDMRMYIAMPRLIGARSHEGLTLSLAEYSYCHRRL